MSMCSKCFGRLSKEDEACGFVQCADCDKGNTEVQHFRHVKPYVPGEDEDIDEVLEEDEEEVRQIWGIR